MGHMNLMHYKCFISKCLHFHHRPHCKETDPLRLSFWLCSCWCRVRSSAKFSPFDPNCSTKTKHKNTTCATCLKVFDTNDIVINTNTFYELSTFSPIWLIHNLIYRCPITVYTQHSIAYRQHLNAQPKMVEMLSYSILQIMITNLSI